MKAMTTSALCALFMGATAFAGDFKAEYTSAFELFQKRGETVENAKGCVRQAEVAYASAESTLEKFNARVLQSRCTYFVGEKIFGRDKDETRKLKMEVFDKGMDYAEEAKKLVPERAEGFYYFGINLGKWGLANGVERSLSRRHELRRTMEAIVPYTPEGKQRDLSKIKKAIDDEGREVLGLEYDGYGVNRTLGKLYYELPKNFNGSKPDAEKLLREAVTMTPKDSPNGLNVVYFADALIAVNKKDEAKRVLDELLSYEETPEKYNPKRVPETIAEIAQAKVIRAALGN